ncbi:MAG TPA: NAD-dependent epimerase/dehydratase family protein [Burkholderiaceae bacterium]|jgi:UDP-glucose 4-epimerase|nr:NAD-dependent epimerase/dehydratase family protein [Burkholderiaceae bacterium]
MSPADLGAAYDGRQVLVTGGAGFIGSNLARRLADLGARVTVVDSLLPNYGGNLFNLDGYENRLRINIADVRGHGMEFLVRNQHVIFNLAGQVSHIDSMSDPHTDLEINCHAQLSLLEACRRGNPGTKIVFASTRQIYGVPQYVPIDEVHPVRPTDVNGINKMAGEWYHILYNNVHGIRACSLRLTNTYGPRMLVKHSRQTALGWFVRQALDGDTIQIWGDGNQLRDYTYVDDVVDAFLAAGVTDAANGHCINLGGLRPVSHVELMSTLTDIAGTGSWKLVPFPPQFKKIDVGDTYCTHALANRLLGWQPKTELAAGLASTVSFYRSWREHYWN